MKKAVNIILSVNTANELIVDFQTLKLTGGCVISPSLLGQRCFEKLTDAWVKKANEANAKWAQKIIEHIPKRTRFADQAYEGTYHMVAETRFILLPQFFGWASFIAELLADLRDQQYAIMLLNAPSWKAQQESSIEDKKDHFFMLQDLGLYTPSHQVVSLDTVEQALKTSLEQLNIALPFSVADVFSASALLRKELSDAQTRSSLFSLPVAEDETVRNQFQLFCNKALAAKLVKTSFGQPAFDGGVFKEEYTEVKAFTEATFTYRPEDKCIAMTLQGSPAYERNYAYQSKLHGVFEKEFSMLFVALGLEVRAENNWHLGIIFTESASKKLMAMGMCFADAQKAKQAVNAEQPVVVTFGKSLSQTFFASDAPPPVTQVVLTHTTRPSA